ncbi:MAG: hypothetical protein ACRD3V_12050 [Vicinamibacteria bacterium]
MKQFEKPFVFAMLAGWLVLSGGSPAVGAELWVGPTHYVAPSLNLLWPITGSGLAVFGFAVPEDMASFASAQVALLPGTTVTGNYDVYVEVKRSGEPVEAGDLAFSLGNGPLLLVEDELQDVDISSLLTGLFDGGSAGTDYVNVFFWFPTGSPAASEGRVLGLRFVYDTVPSGTGEIANGAITTAKLADGAVNSAKVLDESLTAADLAFNSVGELELAADSVRTIDIIDNQVTSADIEDNGIASSDIFTNTIQADDIATGAVASSEILDNSITSADVDTISATKIDFDVHQSPTARVLCNSVPKVFVPASTCPFGDQDGPSCQDVGLGAFCEYDAGQCSPELDVGLDNCPGSLDFYVRLE